jgi:hypothetical protein
MSNIEENAFQIARYLLENHQEDGQVAIRNALRLSPDDFGFALKLLVDGGCCSTYGQPQGKESGIKRNIAKLEEFLNRISEKRIQITSDAERLLKYLYDEQADFPFSLRDEVMTKFNWSETQYTQAAQELDDNDFVRGEYASGNPFFKIFILPPGRKVVRNNFRSEKISQSTVLIDRAITINDNKGIVNINSTLTSVYQSVEENSYIDSSSKQEIEKLLQQLESALKEVPNENTDGAETVAEMAKSLIENATKEKPNKKLIEISAEGLKKAAKDLAVIIPSVLLISERLISFILALHH